MKKLIEIDDTNYKYNGTIYLHFKLGTDNWTILTYAYKMCLSKRLKTSSVIQYGETWKGEKSLVIVLMDI